MKKVLLFSLMLVFTFSFFSFNFQSTQTMVDNVVVQFVTTNGYGNNLYVDNLTVGNQYQYDITVSSLNNIPKDTNYSFSGTSSFKVAPKITVTNIGTTTASSFNVVMLVGSYNNTKSVTNLMSGSSVEVTFDSLTIAPNTPLNIKTYSTLSQDQNKSNDTLSQYSLFLPGARRNVVFEAFTSSTCAPCASQNPSLDAFIAARFDTIVPIKYHVWWPSPGNDPMYLANTTQIQNRTNYAGVSAVPSLKVDGVILQVSGYTTLSNLLNPYNLRLSKGTPISITVTDTKITGDSIKSNISVNVISPLSSGNYRLRACSMSRNITYSSPPGTNGETVFSDVFRFMYPDVTGAVIPTTPGTYNFEYRYKLSPFAGAVDTAYYTAAFVQNDVTKEILNGAKGRNFLMFTDSELNEINRDKDVKAVSNPELQYMNNLGLIMGGTYTETDLTGFNFEMFEGTFPPAGWTITNPDNGITWEHFSGANGPIFGGTKSARVNFYAYSASGQMDYLTSRIFNNIDLTDSIKFNWAYAQYSASYIDRMQVKVSTNGGSTFPYTIFDRQGSALATAPTTTSDFVPSSGQWGTFAIRFGNILTGISRIGNETPDSYQLEQNYPNPFNPVTNIVYAVPKNSNVSLKVYDILGNLVSTLYQGNQNAGIYITQFDASKLSSGIYFYALTADNFKEVKKMSLLK